MGYEEPKKRTFYARDIFRDLCNAKPSLVKMKGQGKKYDGLIDALLVVGDEDPYPASKDLQQKLGLNSGRLKKLVDELHDDFINAISERADLLQFPLVEHHFYVQGYEGSISFDCQLPVTPRLGEEIAFPFVGVYVSSRCYVTEVKYLLSDGKVRVEVWARVGSYNQHREYLRDKAEFENRLSWDNKFKHDYEVDKQIKEIFPDSSAYRSNYAESGHKTGQFYKKGRYYLV